MKIYEILKKALKDKGITLEELGEKTNTSKVRIHNYLNGKTKIDIDIFLKICTGLDLNPSKVIEEYIPKSISTNSKEICELQSKVQLLEEELFYAKQILYDLKSDDLPALVYSRSRRALISMYWINFENENFDSVIRKIPEDDESYAEQYKDGLRIYDETKEYNIDPNTFRKVVELFEFNSYVKLDTNRLERKELSEMITRGHSEGNAVRDVSIYKAAQMHGDKFIKEYLKIHKEELKEYFKKFL